MPKTDPIPRTGNRLRNTGVLFATVGTFALSACGGSPEKSPAQEVRDVACKVVNEIAEGTPDGTIDTSDGFITLELTDAVNGRGEPTDASIMITVPESGSQETPDAVCEAIQTGDVSVSYTNIPDDRDALHDAGWVELDVKAGRATSVSGGRANENGYSPSDVTTVEKALAVMSSAKSH